MQHYFTSSQRLAIEIFGILRQGGIVEGDFLRIQTGPIKGSIEERLFSREVYFGVDAPGDHEPVVAYVTVTLKGIAKEGPPPLSIIWKLDKIELCLASDIRTNSRELSDHKQLTLPTKDVIWQELVLAKAAVRKQESLLRLTELLDADSQPEIVF